MRKRLLFILSLAGLLLSGCVQELPPLERRGVELKVFCDDPVRTKAGTDGPENGVTSYNENKISWVDFFFYPGENPSGDAVCHVRKESGKEMEDTFRIDISGYDERRLFPSASSKMTVFAVVNYPEDAAPLVAENSSMAGTSLEELGQKLVRTDFVSPTDHKQPRFLMSGTAVLEHAGEGTELVCTGTVEVTRFACKMTVSVKVEDVVKLYHDEAQTYYEEWRPMLEGMKIYLVDGVRTVKLAGEDDAPADDAFFSYRSNQMPFVWKNAQDGSLTPYLPKTGLYYNTFPMYMYPQQWEYGQSTGPNREPYLKLVLPWSRSEACDFPSTQREYYYKIVLPDEKIAHHFIRNNWYHLDIDVGILGSQAEETAVLISPCSCYIADWQDIDQVIKQAEIGKARYLSVERDTVEIRNIDEISIPYLSSHPVTIKPGSLRVTRRYYGTKISGSAFGGTIRKAGAGNPDHYPEDTYYIEYTADESWVSPAESGMLIDYHHTLVKDLSDENIDYSPYHVTFTLVHEDLESVADTPFQHTITILQYPPIYIEALRNSDNTVQKASGHQRHYTSDHWGYVYVDGGRFIRTDYYYPPNSADPFYTLTTDWEKREYQWRTVYYSGGSRDIFKINVTVLSEDSELVIGDPRTDEIDNLGYHSDFEFGWVSDRQDGFAVAPALYGDSPRRLSYYYPTEESERTRYMLAPSYRISSKFSGIEYGTGYFSDITYEFAKYRCAGFQEDGFPAGRWRLPTLGEILFIAQLSAYDGIGELFSFNGTYWSAHGAVKVNHGSVTMMPNAKTALLRCVYDAWYWGDEQQEDRDQFIWGDKER